MPLSGLEGVRAARWEKPGELSVVDPGTACSTGVGKTTRHVKLKKQSDVEDARLVDYVRQAAALDAR